MHAFRSLFYRLSLSLSVSLFPSQNTDDKLQKNCHKKRGVRLGRCPYRLPSNTVPLPLLSCLPKNLSFPCTCHLIKRLTITPDATKFSSVSANFTVNFLANMSS